jgi:DNA-binding NarL/FixJ family response regulator
MSVDLSYAERAAAAPTLDVILIERRTLIQECLTAALKHAGHQVAPFASVEGWLDAALEGRPGVIILSAPSAGHAEVELLAQVLNGRPSILMSDADDPNDAVSALAKGLRGYIPATMSLGEAFEAMRLVAAGGTFIPASCLLAAIRQGPVKQTPGAEFSPRQAAVAAEICKGKPNKIIAYDLNMCESTVKVHVRNIMKRLKVRNRTQVAYALRQMEKGSGQNAHPYPPRICPAGPSASPGPAPRCAREEPLAGSLARF